MFNDPPLFGILNNSERNGKGMLGNKHHKEIKHKKGFWGRNLAVFLFCLLTVLFFIGRNTSNVMAEGGVMASIQFGEQMDSSIYDQPIEIGLYRIGTYNGSGYEMDPAFSYAEALAGATAEEADAIIAQVESDLKQADGTFITPDYSTTVAGSSAVFTGVAPGAYLAALTSGPSEVSMMSFFFLLTDGGGVDIAAKWGFVTEARVQKVWEDGRGRRGQDGIRPSFIKVQLYGDDVPVGSAVVLSEQNDWTASEKQLPKFNVNGEAIVYAWHEIDPNTGDDAGHTYAPRAYIKREVWVEEEGIWKTTITNTHTPRSTVLSVRKVWDDEDDKAKRRPLTLTVSLLADGKEVGSYKLNSENNWMVSTGPLPEYKDGSPITYTWSEVSPEGYVLESAETDITNPNRTVLTNKYSPDTTSVVVEKVWDDNNDQDGKRPVNNKGDVEVTVSLVNASDPDTKIQTVTLNEANNWKATVTDLDKYEVVKVKDETTGEEKEVSQEIVYTWIEDVPEGYEVSYGQNGQVTTVTNTHVPETVEYSVRKVWEDDDNKDGKRPASVTVELLSSAADPESPVVASVELNEANGWFATVKDLPKYHDGAEINYIWKEIEVPFYISSMPVREEGSTTAVITNTYIIVTPSVTPSITPEETPTPTVTPSITPEETPTPTVTPTVTPEETPTPSVTPSITPEETPTPSVTPSVSPTVSVTVSPTPYSPGGNTYPRTTPPAVNPPTSSVRTADDTNVVPWMIMIVLSFGVLLLTITYMRRSRRDQ